MAGFGEEGGSDVGPGAVVGARGVRSGSGVAGR